MLKIIFFKGILETLDYFIDKLCLGASELGIDYIVANARYPETFQSTQFYDYAKSPDTVLFTINQVGLNLMEGNENFWSKYNIPVYNFINDHPYNYDDFLNNPVKNLHLFVLDYDHEDYIRKYYYKDADIHFLPNGGWETNSIIPYENREIDIFYAGNCNPVQPWVQIPYFPDGGQNFYETCYSILISNSFLPIETAIEIYCSTQENISFELQKTLIIDYGFIIMHNVRRYFKLKMMHAIESTGAYIEIRGDGWLDNDEQWAANVHIQDRVSSEECNRLSGNSKIGLNFMPWYKRGCSERVFNIMLNASICLTDTSEYLLERFEHGKNIVFFNYNDIDGLKSDISFLLNNPNSAKLIAKNGYNIAQNNDTWIHRMRQIKEVMEK